MADFILGVAGHVDHGKTALVKALTGVETDRLAEEKRRGLTIEPGFAPLPLPGGGVAGLVDVPGHEKFIRNMLSGAAGVTAALLCVAADDAVMPQTVEHLDICALLGVRHFLAAITKTDLVPPARIAEVEAEIRSLPHLEAVPVVPVSARTGAGIPALKRALADMGAEISGPNREHGPFRLNIDRVFSRDGFGTIVTGTLTEGTVSVGDEVQLYPGEKTARVRAIQSHGQNLDRLFAGRRCALNLADAARSEIRRGDAAAPPGTMAVTRYAEAELELLAHAAFSVKTGARLHFYHGARELMCRCTLRGRQVLHPGERCPVRLRFETPLSARPGDRFVVRFFSPMRTVGGGVLTALERGQGRGLPPDPLDILHEYHAKYPLRDGMDRAELLQRAGTLEGARLRGTTVALPGFRPRYTPELAKIRDKIEVYYRRAKLTPAENRAVDPDFDGEVMRRLLRDGVLVPLGADYRVHRRYLEQAENALYRLKRFTLAQYRDELGIPRKYALLLLEHFDRAGLTVKNGDIRHLSVDQADRRRL